MTNLLKIVFVLVISVGCAIISVVDDVRLLWAKLQGRGLAVPAVGRPVAFSSHGRMLHGWIVSAVTSSDAMRWPRALLILHGIGDKPIFWRQAQAMLAQAGVSSLVFDYSGYGQGASKSQGTSSQANLEQDAVAAYQWFRANLPDAAQITVLGYSLGSGLAAEIAPRLRPAPAGIVLCQSYTSFREAAARVVRLLHLPALLVRLAPDLWRTRETVVRSPAPLLVLHGDADALFPVAMAREIHQAAVQAGIPSTLVVIPGYGHNDIYLQVQDTYWRPVLELMKSGAEQSAP